MLQLIPHFVVALSSFVIHAQKKGVKRRSYDAVTKAFVSCYDSIPNECRRKDDSIYLLFSAPFCAHTHGAAVVNSGQESLHEAGRLKMALNYETESSTCKTHVDTVDSPSSIMQLHASRCEFI